MKQNDLFQGCTRRRLLIGSLFSCGISGFSIKANAERNNDDIQKSDDTSPSAFIRRVFEMREEAVRIGDQPYGAVIVNPSGEIVGQAPSRVIMRNDPTAHAEMEAIRDATHRLGTRDLSGHVIYSSSRPCPMCEAAAYWADISGMIHGKSGQDAGRPQLCG